MTPATLWQATHESGTYAEWDLGTSGGHQDSGPGTAVSAIDTAHAHTGTYALKMTTDTTLGQAGARNFRWAVDFAGTPLPQSGRYEAWYYLDQNYSPTTFLSLMQWKTKTDDGSGSAVDMSVMFWLDGANGMRLWLYDQHIAGDRFQYSPPNAFAPATWHKLVVDYVWHLTSGSITSTLDGARWLYLNGVATETVSTSTSPRYRSWSINNYTDQVSPSPSTIWVDDVNISTFNTPSVNDRLGQRRGTVFA